METLRNELSEGLRPHLILLTFRLCFPFAFLCPMELLHRHIDSDVCINELNENDQKKFQSISSRFARLILTRPLSRRDSSALHRNRGSFRRNEIRRSRNNDEAARRRWAEEYEPFLCFRRLLSLVCPTLQDAGFGAFLFRCILLSSHVRLRFCH